MMDALDIRPYQHADNEAALALEAQCPQGKSLRFSFQRRSFHLRSELYENAQIYAAFAAGRMIATIAGAVKDVRLNGTARRAGYIYDIRVHPQYRRQGVAQTITDHVLAQLVPHTDLIYCLVAGQNRPALRAVQKIYRAEVTLPLQYFALPVYRRQNETGELHAIDFAQNHAEFVQRFPRLDFYCQPPPARLRGYVGSYEWKSSGARAGCSLWTNREILAERVEHIPWQFAVMRRLFAFARPLLPLPHIPQTGEFIQSWLLFDFYADSPAAARALLAAINNRALPQGMQYLYLLLQKSHAFGAAVRAGAPRWFAPTLPYFLLAHGPRLPAPEAEIYIDVRDL